VTAAAIRQAFPLLRDGKIAFLDTAASSQKPDAVLEAMDRFQRTSYANVHRGAYHLSVVASDAYENARKTVAEFLHAETPESIVFTKGTTDGINLLAASLSQGWLRAGDEVLLTEQEHHANIVPWQLWSERVGFRIRVLPVDERGDWDLARLDTVLTDRTRLVAAVHVSNSLGSINPVETLVAEARRRGVPVLLDGAQAVAHGPVDVRALDCDFYVFSGHKLYGPTGIGVLYGKRDWLRKLPPAYGGGGMIAQVTFEKTTFAEPPARFEAGTPPIVEAVGLDAAIRFLRGLDATKVFAEEARLGATMRERVAAVPGARLIGNPRRAVGIVSFVLADVHAHDVATVLDTEGVCVRAGHHCTQPLMRRYGVPSTLRASLGVYNDVSDVDRLVAGLEKARKVFRL
jgi:cysteine desulfurase/selenocysteine lyase